MSDSTPTPAAPTPPSTVKPIPPSKEKGVAPASAGEQARDADGKFVAKDAKSDPAGAARDMAGRSTSDLPDLEDISTSLYADADDLDRDRPVATLPGMISEEKGSGSPKAQRRQSVVEKTLAKDQPATAEERTPAIVAKEAAAVVGDEAPAVPEPVPVDPSAPPPPSTKFKFAGEDFESQEKAEQNFKTLRGMYRKETTDRQNAEKIAKANYDAADHWKKKAEGYERGELKPPTKAAPSGNGQPATADSDSLDPDDAVVNDFDWDSFDRVKRRAKEKYPNNPEVVEQLSHAFTVRETARILRKQQEARFEKFEAPDRERQEIIGHAQAIAAQMDTLSDHVDHEGNPAYPEFADPEARSELGRAFRERANRGIPWEFLKTPEGIYETVTFWREWRRRVGRPWTKVATPPIGGNGNPPPQAASFPDDAGVDSALRSIEGRNAGVMDARRAPVRPSADNPQSQIRRKIMESDKRSTLGWSE